VDDDELIASMADGDDAFRELFSRHAPWLAARHESLADRGPGPGDVDLGRVWLGVAAQVWRRRPGPVERAAGRLLRSPGLARALVTTPSLLAGWLIATAVVLLAGVFATLGTGTPYVPLLAPAVAAAGIAYAYGPGRPPAGGSPPSSPTPRSSFPTWRSGRSAPRSPWLLPGSREERHER
jgi:hypothetical protein